MATFEQAGRSLRVLADKVGENSTKLVKETALAVDEAVVTTTPVRDGQARYNWIVSIGSPSSEFKGMPASPGAGAAGALAQGQATIGQYAGQGEIHVTNNTPYIVPLNNGSSSQAPEGFVETAIQAGVEVVRKARLLK